MSEGKMVAMWCCCDGSISESVQGHKLYKRTNFQAFMKKWKKYLHIFQTIYMNLRTYDR